MPIDDLEITALATDYPAGFLIEEHSHDAHQILHAVSGVMRARTADAVWILSPGRALWIPSGQMHEIRCLGRLAMRSVYVKGAHPALPAAMRVTAVSGLMREAMARLAEGAAPALIGPLTQVILAEMAALKTAPLLLPRAKDPRVARLLEALESDPADATPLEAWAPRLGLSRRSLIRRIGAETGASFRDLRRRARIAAAMERLAEGRSVTEVAFETGFESPSAFIAAFRGVVGETPGAWLRRARTP